MKLIFLGLLFSLTASSLFAQPVETSLLPKDIKVPAANDLLEKPIGGVIEAASVDTDKLVRKAIDFVPFPRVNPSTGKVLNPTDRIVINGKEFKAKDYFDEIDAAEKRLNAYGYTLRDKVSKEVIEKLKLDMDPIIRSATKQAGLDFDFDAQYMAKVEDLEAFAKDLETKAGKAEDDILRGFEKLASSEEPEGFQIKLGPLDKGVIKEPTTKPLSGDTHKEWTFGPQEPGQIGINGKAVLHFGIDQKKKKAEAIASARSDGMLLKQPFNLLYGHVFGLGQGSSSDDRYSADLSAEVYLTVLGVERFKWADKKHTWTKKVKLTEGKKKDQQATASSGQKTTLDKKSVEQKEGNPVTEWIEANRETLGLEPWSYNVLASWKWYFMVGPVPGKGEVGLDGVAGVDWGSGVNIDGVKTFLNFNAGVNVYGDGSLGIEQVLEGGVRAEVVLLKVDFNFNGSAKLSINDQALAKASDTVTDAYKQRSPLEVKIVTALTGTRALTFLDGEVMAYVNYPMPKATPPFYEMKRFENVFFDWEGFTKTGMIFNFEKVNTIGKFQVFGATSPDDTEGAQLDVKLDDHFNGIIDEAPAHSQTLSSNDAAVARQMEARNEFLRMIENAKR